LPHKPEGLYRYNRVICRLFLFIHPCSESGSPVDADDRFLVVISRRFGFFILKLLQYPNPYGEVVEFHSLHISICLGNELCLTPAVKLHFVLSGTSIPKPVKESVSVIKILDLICDPEKCILILDDQ
jgi:hypothetical protein